MGGDKCETVQKDLSFAAQQWFSSGGDFAFRVQFGNVCRPFFGGGCNWHLGVGTKNVAKHPEMHRADPTIKWSSNLNIKSKMSKSRLKSPCCTGEEIGGSRWEE